MIVTGALAWWNERPEDLYNCIHHLHYIADRVVAIDGAYSRYPMATIHSGQDQVDAIYQAARDIKIECEVIQPDQLWQGQVEKRTALLRAAAKDSDWIAVVDTDHLVNADRDRTRAFLATTQADVISVPFATPQNIDRPLEQSAVGYWHMEQMSQIQYIPHLYRAFQDMRVERFHWWYSALKDGQRYWIWGGDGSYPSITPVQIETPYQINHMCMYRTPEQIRLSRAFLNDREWVVSSTGQEDDQPGLERPHYNFDRLPL